MTRTPLIPPHCGSLGLAEFVAPVVHAVVTERLAVDASLVAGRTSLAGDLAADSLDLLEVVIELESRFAVHIPEREIERVRTIDDLVRTIVVRLYDRDHPTAAKPRLVTAA